MIAWINAAEATGTLTAHFCVNPAHFSRTFPRAAGHQEDGSVPVQTIYI